MHEITGLMSIAIINAIFLIGLNYTQSKVYPLSYWQIF